MSIIDRMYQGYPLPPTTPNSKAQQIHDHLQDKLLGELNKCHRWLAVGYTAVVAGQWRGERLRRRRLKLLKLVNECRQFLRLPLLQPKPGWEMHNLHYGFEAVYRYAGELGLDPEIGIILGMVDSGIASSTQACALMSDVLDRKES